MPAIVNVENMIFIGNLTTIDNDESDAYTDNATAIAGNYGPGQLEIVAVTNHDQDGDGAILDDEMGGSDYVEYSVGGGGTITQVPDATILYDAVVTELDGTTHTIVLVVIQMVNGDTFVGDSYPAGDMDNLNIENIELTTVKYTHVSGYSTSYGIDNTTVCFAQGTLIETPNGPRRVETLSPGMQVLTCDNGPRPIRWIGSVLLATPGKNAAIQIDPGALGIGIPTQTLRVSPQHRLMVRSPIAKRMFGLPEVLIAAKRLLPMPGIRQERPHRPVRYWHVLLDQHELLSTHGCWTESLLLGAQARFMLDNESRAEIDEIFPEFSKGTAGLRHIRPIPPGKQQAMLAVRHHKNEKCLLH